MNRLMICLAILLASCSQPKETGTRYTLDELNQDRRCAEEMVFFQPPDGMLSTDAIAKDVALRYLREVFPQDDHLEPLAASLQNGVWKFHSYLEKGSAGGVAEIELCQSNGRVLTVYHTQ